MMTFPIQILPADLAAEAAALNAKLTKGVDLLSSLTDEDVDIGSTPKDVIFEQDGIRVYHYHPTVEKSKIIKTPLLIVPPLINGYEVADLQPDRSVVRNLLNQGIDVYLNDWGYPRPVDKHRTVDDYINGYLDEHVDFIRHYHGVDKIALFGICQGGTISTTYSTLHQDKISHLTLTVSPIDFDAYRAKHKPHEGLMFTMGADADVDKMVAVHGNVPADVLNVSFLMASPFILNFGKYADVIDILDDRPALLNFLRMEKWLFGGPDAVGQTFKEFIRDFLKGNKLVKGTLEVGGRKVDLQELKIPILNIFAEKDHIVPPPCTVALGKHVGSKDYTEFAINTGHIGIYTGGLAQKVLAPTVANWMRERGA
ncbi:MAG TPA: class III poly(R)-hydroxyalkanoic acid synthase subunit PhaC [Accumulibacter sp.]|uniref:class III poly(R)-hydroxyalkanoic acid synthase subunit PhaC n=3 Tax=Accumulibacter sp. TaxID=2053492 RepID=UPI002614E3F5|nr:class III poly(R)-hydroxyalkanoic acid synthase subunit PhaC [Accumulibacter sp.]MDS4053421.1 class III poly(R)-hydroxyalkanoic acid synthase subunit PhaC [Accumulibacter sp.]HMW64683.1 class III poly(R)-hydroxyalkanoic acid synthase subunit PhaC [Accumulibacter sp.]HMW81433.1 class III poly(R)-hydroxyalkanoic acid synthase subunit PhaC [Accumulibacter sp.]HMX68333.1 class III poly(R)-hydroxyalkanoic acid synthase subunit PhaC [Accumulibacter sp.]HNB69278.1 class III poly(R)-hydroxyalkanoic